MKKYLYVIAVLAFVITIALIKIQSCSSSASVPVECVKTPGNTAEIVIDEGENTNIKSSLLVYPTEIYLGDTVYVLQVDENISSGTINFYPVENEFFWRIFIGGSASSGGFSYEWITEYDTKAYIDKEAPHRDLQPSEKRFQSSSCFEFPPLEDLKIVFWEELRYGALPKGKNLQFYIGTHGKKTQVNILVKPRPESEMALLDTWYKNTPEKTFPEVSGNRKIPHEMIDLQASKKSWIKIGHWVNEIFFKG